MTVYIPGVLWGFFFTGLLTTRAFEFYLDTEPGIESLMEATS